MSGPSDAVRRPEWEALRLLPVLDLFPTRISYSRSRRNCAINGARGVSNSSRSAATSCLALPTPNYTAGALSRTNLTVRIGTKLKPVGSCYRTAGTPFYPLPGTHRGGRSTRDRITARLDSRSSAARTPWAVVQQSRGTFAPASPLLMGETAIDLPHGRRRTGR